MEKNPNGKESCMTHHPQKNKSSSKSDYFLLGLVQKISQKSIRNL